MAAVIELPNKIVIIVLAAAIVSWLAPVSRAESPDEVAVDLTLAQPSQYPLIHVKLGELDTQFVLDTGGNIHPGPALFIDWDVARKLTDHGRRASNGDFWVALPDVSLGEGKLVVNDEAERVCTDFKALRKV